MASLVFDTHWNEKQKEAFRYLLWFPEITEIWYWGAAWGGKSYTWVSWVWMMCNKYPWVRYFFGRQELKRLKQTTLATYFKFLWDYKIPEEQRWLYNSQDSVIRFSNGSEILLLDLAYLPSDPLYTRFGSLELTGWYIDESAEIDEQCITILMTRIGRQKNEEYSLAPKLLEWFNPDRGQVYRRYYKPWKDWILPNYRKFIPALATDNKLLPKSYIQQLMKADEITKQRLLYWNFDYDDTPWRLFDHNAILNMWGNPAINWDRYLSIDVARKWKDSTVIFEWDGLEVVKIRMENITQIHELSEMIKKEYQWEIPVRNIIADENGVGGGLIDNLRCQWFINNARPIEPKKANISTLRNYDMLKTQCYFKLAEYVNLWKIRISVDNKTFKEKLIEELDVIVEIWLDKDWKIKIIKKEDVIAKLGRSPDFSDAMMMRMFYEVSKREGIKEEEVAPKYEHPMDEIIFKDDEIVEDEINFTPF